MEKCLERLCYDDELITTLGTWRVEPHQIWPYMLSEDSSHLIRSIDGVQKLSAVVEGNKYEKVGTVSLEVHRGFPVHVSITPTCLIIRDNMRRIQYQDTSYNEISMTQDKARKIQ